VAVSSGTLVSVLPRYLVGLLTISFGIYWVWMLFDDQPPLGVLIVSMLSILVLGADQIIGWQRRGRPPHDPRRSA
jgi:hypothetical protein